MRRLRAVAAAAAFVLVLSGCGVLSSPYQNRPSDGGQPASAIVEQLEAIPGVAAADIRHSAWDQPGEGGLFSSSGMNFTLEIDVDPEHRVADAAAFLDAALRLLWSYNGGFSPKGSLLISLDGGTDVDHDWESDIQELYGSRGTGISREERETGITVAVSDTIVQEWFGPWPATPQVFPTDLIARGAPLAEDPLAITDLRISGVTSVDDCWSLGFDIGLAADGTRYPGDVTVTLFVRGEEEGTEVSRESDRNPEYSGGNVQFCYDERRPGNFGSIAFDVSTQPVDGFQTVDVEKYTGR